MTLPIFAETSNGIGVFSVSATKLVTFSTGNLQYHPANNEWRFAENQYDIIGEDNKNISTDYDGWIDLFGWSASDGSAKFGVSSSKNNNDYAGDFVDWGKNQIGSDAPDTWRTMTMDEWCYLCNTRMKADSLRGLGQINGVNGLILLPDNWTCPVGVTFDASSTQKFTIDEWSRLEAEGAVFLPCAGFRYGSDVTSVNSRPTYWSSTEYDSSTAHDSHPEWDGILAYYINLVDRKEAFYYRYTGLSVRLVKDVVRLDQDTHPIFSVSETKQVTFSPGNLQYHPANNEWRFAENQTDYIGKANSNCSSSYNGWLDLFGWSTSATNFGVSTLSGDNNNYSGNFVDWGTNQIGSDAPNTWRTLSYDEWYYLRYNRTNANDLVGVGQVNGVNGLILLPDNWTCPAGITFKSGFHSSLGEEYYAAYQTFTLEQWKKMEDAGAVFLPAAGFRIGSSMNEVQMRGFYWSATGPDSYHAYYLTPRSKGAGMSSSDRYRGQSVRLVKDIIVVPKGIFSVSTTRKVLFSPGNLQYHPKNREWRFAPHQWDNIGTSNTLTNFKNPEYDDWLDLFCWSAEGTNSGLDISADYSGNFVDWGNNTISGYAPNTWRTMTIDEWEYLLNGRPNATDLRAAAQVNGVNGWIFLPDNWTCPAEITFSPGIGYENNIFDIDQWLQIEEAGAIFLPSAGIRRVNKENTDNTNSYGTNAFGRYWTSSTISNGGNANYFYILNDNVWGNKYATGRSHAQSVRLAQDLHPIQVDATTTKVTSTVGQTISKAVRINISDRLGSNITIIGTSDNPAFTVVDLENVSSGEQNLIVNYTPTAVTDGIETATITLSCGTIENLTSFTMTGRHLAQNFVIAAKAGNEYVALTAKVSNGTQVAVPIKVNNTENPTKATIALNTCQYQLLGLKYRFNANGTAVHLYSTQTQNVLNASTSTTTKTYLNTGATHDNAEKSDTALFYEWQLVTNDLIHYTITNCNTQNTENRVLGYSSSTGEWGLYQSSNVVNQEVFLLPIETTLTEKDIEVMEWGTNSMALRFGDAAPANMNVTLGETNTNVTLKNINSSDIYLVDNLSGLTNNDHEVMVISYNGQGTFVRKPILVSGDVVSTNYSTLAPEHRDVVILNGGKLNAGDAYVDFANIYVYPGGKLVLDRKSLGVKQQVYLRGGYSWLNQTTYALPEVYLNGTINFNGSGNMIYDYYIQNYKYYQFCLPYTVSLAKVTDEAGVDNFPVWVKHYNGELRAANAYATSWEYYNGDNFEAGKGYIIAAKPRQVDNVKNRPLSIIRFPLGNKAFNSTNGLENDLQITTTAHGINGYKDGTVTANNVGWNFVGNPFLATWKGDIGHKQLEMHYENGKWDGSYHWVDSEVKYITVMSAESGSDYAQYVANDTVLKPFFPFFMQEAAEGEIGTINFAATGRMKKAPIMLSAKTTREAFVQLEMIADGEKDQTGMFIGEHYSDDIDFDDYEKMFGSSTDNTKLWLMHEGKRMAFEAMTESTAAAYTPLGYRAPKKGTYYMDVNLEVSDLTDVEAIYLSDNLSEVSDYDLLEGAYEFESDATTYNDNRFVVRVVLRNEAPGTATDIENIIGIHSDSESPYKFIYQNRMYIMRNGIIYDATGQQVLTINK